MATELSPLITYLIILVQLHHGTNRPFYTKAKQQQPRPRDGDHSSRQIRSMQRVTSAKSIKWLCHRQMTGLAWMSQRGRPLTAVNSLVLHRVNSRILRNDIEQIRPAEWGRVAFLLNSLWNQTIWWLNLNVMTQLYNWDWKITKFFMVTQSQSVAVVNLHQVIFSQALEINICWRKRQRLNIHDWLYSRYTQYKQKYWDYTNKDLHSNT